MTWHRSRSLALVVAFGANLLLARALAQTIPQINFRPIKPAGTNVGFASALPATNTPAASDPRLAGLSRWLKAHFNNIRATNIATASTLSGTQPHMPTNTPAAVVVDYEVHRRSGGSIAQIKRSRSTVSSPAAGKPAKSSAEPAARSFLRTHKQLFDSLEPDSEFILKREDAEETGRRHLRFEQHYKGLPVWPCELMVHTSADGEIDLLESTAAATPQQVNVNPTLAGPQAVERVRRDRFRGASTQAGKPELIIYAPLDKPPRLAWRFDMSSTVLDAARCVVDAQTGEILSAVSLVHDGAVVGSGVDSLGVPRTLNLWQNAATYYMANSTKPMFIAGSVPPDPDTTQGEILILDSMNTPASSNPQNLGNPVYAASASANSGWGPDAVSAAYGMSEVFDYYSLRHGRNSYDGSGSSLIACVRVGIGFQNAFWTQQLKLMVFGDGYPRSLDVCGHEVTHGVINSIGNGGVLDYAGQSGALNEAFADIFGEMVEARSAGTNDWLMGSQLSLPIRSMANPAAYSQPSAMNQFVVTSADNGGVHANSGIINHAYFLLAAGLGGAVGNADAERIFYRALTLHLQKQSQFIDARHACVSSAEELFGVGSPQALKTAEAFDIVGIVDSPASTLPSSIPAVAAADSTMCLRYDFLAQRYFLLRRESALGDPSSGTALYYCSPSRASISGDGSAALFVTENHDLGLLATDDSSIDTAGIPNAVHSVALSPDGHYAAFVFRDSFGQATDQIHVIDLLSSATYSFNLYALSSEGQQLAVVDHADVMDFTADGRFLIYDALCSASTANGDLFDGWAIFSLDVATGGIQTLTAPNTDYNVGNPALGNTKNYLVTFDVFDNGSGVSTVLAGNAFTGQIGVIGTVSGLGVPGYTGDDTAIVYSRYDSTVDTDYTLMRQSVSSDGITKVGSPTTWLTDADYGVIYRRGTFVSSNSLPAVAITNLLTGQSFTNPASITIQASASDTGGSLTRVEFYQGATLLGQDTTSPYSVSWASPPVGSHRLTARAVDNLNGVRDSSPIDIFVYPPPDTTKPTVSFTNPPSARTYTNAQTVVLGASASDNVGVAHVDFHDGGVFKGSDSTSPYAFNWSFTAADNGAHIWTARAYDAAGNTTTSAPVTLTVSIDITPPSVAISSPANGATVATAAITVSGTAADPGSPASGLVGVEVRLNGGSWSNATGTTSWTRSVTLTNCGNTIEARSRDNATNYSIIVSNFVFYTPANTMPATPVNVSPGAGAKGVSVTPVLQASAFSDPDPVCVGDTHASSQWLVLSSSGAAIVADSGTDVVNRVSWTVPSGKLYYGSNYQWQVRYRDSRNGWSSYSARTFFTNSGPLLTSIQRGTNLVFNWPTNSLGFGLQWSTNLGATTWSNATPAPVIVNGQYAVTNNMTNQFRFYRLKK